MDFFVLSRRRRPVRRDGAVSRGGSARRQEKGDGRRWDVATALGKYLHVLMPVVVVITALVFQALHNGLPVVTLIALESAAYGRLLWLEFLEREHRLVQLSVDGATAPSTITSDKEGR